MEKRRLLAGILATILILQTGAPGILQASVGDMGSRYDLILDEDEDLDVHSSDAPEIIEEQIILEFDQRQLESRQVPIGTEIEDLDLPRELKVKAHGVEESEDQARSKTVIATWSCAEYDSNTPEIYLFEAQLPEGWTLSSDAPFPLIEVYVLEEEDQWIATSSKALEEVKVPYGTAWEDVVGLPEEIQLFGHLASDSNVTENLGNHPVSWSDENEYDPNTAGSYTIEGTVSLASPDTITFGEGWKDPVIQVKVEEQQQFDATVAVTWNPIDGHKTPTEKDIKQAIFDGLNGQNIYPTNWKDNITIIVTEREDKTGWNGRIEGLPAQYGKETCVYKLSLSITDFIFTPVRGVTITAAASQVTFTATPVLKPTLVIGNTFYGTGIETITYEVVVDNKIMEYEVKANESSQLIQLPDGATKATVRVKDSQRLYTWETTQYELTFDKNKPGQTVEFIHSALIEPAIVTINWNDNQNTSQRPSNDKFALNLSAETEVGGDFLDKANIDKGNSTSYNTWTWTYSGLPSFNKSGELISYTLTADPKDGYILEPVKGPDLFAFEVRYTAEADFKVKLVWKDDSNKFKTRPTTFDPSNLTLFCDGNKMDITNYTTKLQREGEDEYLLVKGLLAYNADGIGKLWSLEQHTNLNTTAHGTIGGEKDGEQSIYKPQYINKGTLALVTTAVYHDGIIENLLSDNFIFKGEKEWQDGGNSATRTNGSLILQRYISRPENSVQNATPISGKSTIALSKDSDTYEIIFKDLGLLPRFDEQGREYIYFVTERYIATNGADQYEKLFENTEAYKGQTASNQYLFPGGTIINRRTGTVKSKVTVKWTAAAQQSVKSSVLIVAQYRVKGTTEWKDIDLGEGGGKIGDFFAEQTSISKTFSWDKYDSIGQELEYQVLEKEVTIGDKTEKIQGEKFTIGDYTYKIITNVSGNDITITHVLDGTHTVTINKVWNGGDYSGIKEIKFNIWQNGKPYTQVSMSPTLFSFWKPIEETGLPAYDNQGKAYTYDVREQVPAGYSARYQYGDSSGSKDPHKTIVTVTNTPVGTSSNASYTLTLEKEWLDGGDTVYREPVVVGIYKKTDENPDNDTLVSSVTIDKDNNWWRYVSVPAVLDENQNKKSLEKAMTEDYYVREISMGGQIISYTGRETHTEGFEGNNQHYAISTEAKVDGTGKKTGTYTISNRRIGTVNINLGTSWTDGNKKDEDRPKLKMTVKRNGADINTSVVLDKDPWIASFSNLEKYDEHGNIYNYTVEVNYEGTPTEDQGDYKQTFVRTGYVVGDKHTNDRITYECKMTRQVVLTDFIINLMWMDNGFTDTTIRPNAVLELYRNADNLTNPERVTNAQRTWNTQMTDWHWTCGFDGLPKYDDKGYLYTYYVISTLSTKGDYVTRYYNAKPKNNQFSIEDNEKEEETVGPQGGTVVHRREQKRTINGTKTWQNVPGSMIATEYPTAIFDLMYYSYEEEFLTKDGMVISKNAKEAKNEKGENAQYPIENGGNSFDFGVLARYDHLGRNIQYFVKEEPIDGYVALTGAVGQFVLSNAYHESVGNIRTIKISKSFNGLPMTLEKEHYPKVTMELWRQMQDKNGIGIGSLVKVEEKTIIFKDDTEMSCVFSAAKYAPNAREWLYNIREKSIPGYEITGTPEEGYILSQSVASDSNAVRNTYTGGETRKISVAKIWKDEENTYATRPESINVNLYRWDGVGAKKLYETVALKAEESWASKEFIDLETYAPNGTKYTYYIQEEEIKGYEGGTNLITVGGDFAESITITNTLQTVDLPVTKQWTINGEELKIGSSSFGLLPEDMNVELTVLRATDSNWEIVQRGPIDNKEKFVQKLPVSSRENIPKFTYKDGVYFYCFMKLPKMDENGVNYKYQVRETGLYSAIEGANLSVGLEATEVGPYGITYDPTGTQITNALKKVTSFSIQPIWDDADNQDGLRPGSIKFKVTGTPGNSTPSNATPSNSTPKEHVITVSQPKSLDNVDAGKVKTHWPIHGLTLPSESLNLATISYGGQQDKVADGYNVSGTNQGNKYSFTFHHVPKTLTIAVNKVWDYNGVAEQEYKTLVSGTTIFAGLKSDARGTVSKVDGVAVLDISTASNWRKEWTSLPASINSGYKNVTVIGKRKLISYEVEETEGDGTPLANGKLQCFLKPTYSGKVAAKTRDLISGTLVELSLTITNKLETISHEIQVEWIDSTNRYLTRPGEGTTMSLQRRKGTSGDFGEYRGDDQRIKDLLLTTALTENTGSTSMGSWTTLPRYASDGMAYQYRGLETKMDLHVVDHGSTGTEETPTGEAYSYEASYVFAYDVDALTSSTKTKVTNTNIIHAEEGKKTFKVTKIWEDDTNKDGKRPASVGMTLFRDGQQIPKVEVGGLGTVNTWEYQWDNLPKYKNGSKTELSKYEVKEDTETLQKSPGYSLASQSNIEYNDTITNAYAPERLNITAEKAWANDQSYKTETRPDKVTLTLQWKVANASEYTNFPTEAEKEIVKQLDGSWSLAEWKDLFRYEGGEKIEYRIVETKVPNGYSTKPETVTIIKEGAPATPTTPAVAAEGRATITNTLQTVDVTAKTTWNYNDVSGGHEKPKYITIQLYRYTSANLEPQDVGKTVTVKPNKQSVWQHKFSPQLKYDPKTGAEYVYGVQEITVGEKTVTMVDGKQMGGGYLVSEPKAIKGDSKNKISLEIKNTLPVLTHKVTTLWENDEDYKDKTRPANTTLFLQQKDATNGWGTIIATNANADTWQVIFEHLPKYTSENTVHVYQVMESKIGTWEVKNNFASGYTVAYDAKEGTSETEITNTLQTISIEVEQTWEDEEDIHKMRPSEVTVQLYQKTETEEENQVSGVEAIITKDGDWKAKIINQLKYKPLTETPYAYSIKETKVGTQRVESVDEVPMGGGYVITNPDFTMPDIDGVVGLKVTDTLPTVSPMIIKRWLGDDVHSSATRPDSIGVQIQKKVGTTWEEVTKATLSNASDPKWQIQLGSLPKYSKENKEMEYQVVEGAVPGYSSVTTPITKEKAELVNTFQSISVNVKTKWVDMEDKYDMRPDKVNVQLYRKSGSDTGAELVGSPVEIAPDETGTWEYTFENLYRYKPKTTDTYTYSVVEIKVGDQEVQTLDGKRIGGGYMVEEDLGSSAGIDNTIYLEITNDLAMTEHKATVEWTEDKNNKYNTRPSQVNVELQELINGQWKSLSDKLLHWEQGQDNTIFPDIPRYTIDNQPRRYRVMEKNVGDFEVTKNPDTNKDFAGGYFVSDVTSEGATTITNRLDTVELEGEIIWVDEDNRYGARPITDNLALTLTFKDQNQNLSPNWNTGWEYSYKALPRWYVDPTDPVEPLKLRIYQVEEVIPDGYLCKEPWAESRLERTGDKAPVGTITNTLASISIKGSKYWQDEEDLWGFRPESGENLILEVKENGTSIEVRPEQISWKGWDYTIKDLPRYSKVDNQQIAYTVEEKTPGIYYTLASASNGILDGNGNKTGVDFTNRLNTGELQLEKIVVGANAPKDLVYTFMVRLDGAGKGTGIYKGNYTRISFDGLSHETLVATKGEILLKAGEKALITGLPVGVTYQVKEQELPGFAITSKESEGTIEKDLCKKVSFTNTVEMDKALEIENKTPEEAPASGGKVIVSTKPDGGINPDKGESDQATGGIRAGWMPDKYWTFGETIVVEWYELGNPNLYTKKVTNYMDISGILQMEAFQELEKTWPNLKVTLEDKTVDLILGDSESMPVKSKIYVNFLPTMATLNITTEEKGTTGKVGFSKERLHPQSDGVEEVDGRGRLKKATEVFAEAETGYYIDLKELRIGGPTTLGEGVEPVVFGENNTFTTQVLVGETTSLFRRKAATDVTITGQVEILQEDDRGNMKEIRIILEDPSIPLDIGIAFKQRSTGGGGTGGGIQPPAQQPTKPELLPEGVNFAAPEGDGTSPQLPTEPLYQILDWDIPQNIIRNSRRVPATGDGVTTTMLRYLLACLLSGGSALGFWHYWKKDKKKEDE